MMDDQQQLEMAVEEREWDVTASRSARNTINPIRRIIDRCELLPNPDKPLISLSIGEI
jgi:tyrosine aminotransferase